MSLTEQEAKLYDRQLRLWGVAAQERLREAKILLYGLTSVQAEICKNLVLAGIHSVTVADTHICVMRDLGSHLFLDSNSIGKNRAEASVDKIRSLNPHVDVKVSTSELTEIDFSGYHLCCVSVKSFHDLFLANRKSRAVGTLFLATDTFGFFGFMFEDLLDFFQFEKKIETQSIPSSASFVSFHSVMTRSLWDNANLVYFALRVIHAFETKHNRTPQSQDEKDTTELITIKNELLTTLKKVGEGGGGVLGQKKMSGENRRSILNRATDEFIRKISENLNTEINPVCAIVGGIVAQEIVKIICRNDVPFVNFFFYNGIDDDNSGSVESIFVETPK